MPTQKLNKTKKLRERREKITQFLTLSLNRERKLLLLLLLVVVWQKMLFPTIKVLINLMDNN